MDNKCTVVEALLRIMSESNGFPYGVDNSKYVLYVNGVEKGQYRILMDLAEYLLKIYGISKIKPITWIDDPKTSFKIDTDTIKVVVENADGEEEELKEDEIVDLTIYLLVDDDLSSEEYSELLKQEV